MKKFISILLATLIFACMAVSVSAATLTVNTENFVKGGGGLLSVNDEGQFSFEFSEGVQTVWGSIENNSDHDISNGFKMTVTDIVWNEGEGNTALTIIVGDSVGDRTWITAKHGVGLLVEKSGNVRFWGIADSNYWAATTLYDDVALDEGATSFTYSLVPNADKTAWTFSVNDVVLYTFNAENQEGWPGMLASLSTKRFGFGVLDGDKTDNLNVPGKLDFTVKNIELLEEGAADDTTSTDANDNDNKPAPPTSDGVLAIATVAVVAGGAAIVIAKKKNR